MSTIGILADKGQPATDAGVARDRLVSAGVLDEDSRLPDGDRVEVAVGTIPMTPDGQIALGRYAESIRTAKGWRKLIYVTDLPITASDRPVVSNVAEDGNAVLLSQPAYGMFGAKRRLVKELTSLLQDNQPKFGQLREIDPEGLQAGEDDNGDGNTHARILTHRGGSIRLILGMMRSNQPGRLLSALSGALAAIAATGGFGVFYGSIWNLSEAMSWPRLFLVAFLAVVVLSAWLIIANKLWVRKGTQVSPWRERIDNASTIGTVMVTVLIIFAVAAAGMMVLALAVAPMDYLGEQVTGPVSWMTYIRIGFLSAALGTFAGAIGSNFDETVEIRSTTYNRREYERRRKVGDRIDSAWEEGELEDMEASEEQQDATERAKKDVVQEEKGR